MENSLDMAQILQYPLTPVLLSLNHIDRTMLKSPKSALVKHLESKVNSIPPTSISVTVIDANLPDTFGGIAKYLLRSLMNHDCQEVHFFTDKWASSYIVDRERDQRGSGSMT